MKDALEGRARVDISSVKFHGFLRMADKPDNARPFLPQSPIVAVMAKKPATAKITATLANPLNGAMSNAAP